jgi:hypothetical protein
MTFPSIVYVATRTSGVYKTTDFSPSGTQPTWETVNDGLASTEVVQFELDPNSKAGRQFVLTGAAFATQILYSRTTGAWSSILTSDAARAVVGETNAGQVRAFCSDSANAGTIYALYRGGDVVSGVFNKIYTLKSSDYGTTWAAYKDTGAQIVVTANFIGALRACNGSLWFGLNASNSGRLWYSGDDGDNWIESNELAFSGWTPNPVNADGQIDTLAYVATTGAVFFPNLTSVSTDGTLTELQTDLTPEHPNALYIDPTNADAQKCVQDDQIFTTSDGWRTLDNASPDAFTPAVDAIWQGLDNTSFILGKAVPTAGAPHHIYVLNDDGSITGRSGSNPDSAPYTDSIPRTAGGVAIGGIGAVAVPVTGATITGDFCTTTGTNLVLTGTVAPANASSPTHAWSSDGLQSGQGTTSATYQWSTTGTKTVTLTISNLGGAATAIATRAVTVGAGNPRQDIYNVVNAVSSTGNVYDYKRWATLYPDVLEIGRATIAGARALRWFEVVAGPFSESRAEFRSTDGRGILRERVFYIQGYLQWNDDDASEKDADDLAVAICNALDDCEILHDGCLYYEARPAQVVAFEPKSLTTGGLLVHYIRIEQRVTQFLTGGGYSDVAAAGSIRDDIENVLGQVSNAGNVYVYKQWAARYPDFLAKFKTTIGGADLVRGFEIEGGPWSENRIEFRSSGKGGILRERVFHIHGYLTWNDGDETEKDAESLAIEVANALDDSGTLHDGQTYYNTDPAQLLEYRSAMFGNILVHYLRFELRITEFLEN